MKHSRSYNFQVGIVGASLAGSIVATLLGRAGIETILIDKATFPRAKPCGEGLSAVAIEKLRALGLQKVFNSIETAPFFGFSLLCDGDDIRLPFRDAAPASSSVGIKRTDLDYGLLKAAIAHPHVEFRAGTQVRKVDIERSGAQICLGEASVSCQVLVLADGVQSFVAHALKVPVEHDGRDRYARVFALRGTFQANLNRVVVALGSGFEIYCTQVGRNELSICILSSKAELLNLQEAQILIETTCRSLGFELLQIVRHQAVGPLGNVRRKPVHERVFLVGDACESMDPLAGMGMTHAIASAECAANAIISYLQGKNSYADAAQRYVKQREKIAKPLRGITRLTYHSLKSPESYRPIRLLSKTPLPRCVGGLMHQSRGSSSFSDKLALTMVGLFGLTLQ